VSTTTCLDRNGRQTLSCGSLSPVDSASTSKDHQVSSALTSTVTISIGANVIDGEATSLVLKHGHDGSPDQKCPDEIEASASDTTLHAGVRAIKGREVNGVLDYVAFKLLSAHPMLSKLLVAHLIYTMLLPSLPQGSDLYESVCIVSVCHLTRPDSLPHLLILIGPYRLAIKPHE
jgi:hypothetical protein